MITLRCKNGHHVTGHADGSTCIMQCITWAFDGECTCACHSDETSHS